MFSLTSFLPFAGGFSNSFLVIAETDWGLGKASAREFSSRWGGDLETTGSTGNLWVLHALLSKTKHRVFSCYVVRNTTCIPIFKAVFLFFVFFVFPFFVVLVLFLLCRYCFAFIIYSVGCLWHSHGKNPVRLYPKLQSQPIGLRKIFIDYLFFQADQSDCIKSVSIFNRFASSEELVAFQFYHSWFRMAC